MRERGIPALSGFPDPGERGGGGGSRHRLVGGRGVDGGSGGGRVKYILELLAARLLLPAAAGAWKARPSLQTKLAIPVPSSLRGSGSAEPADLTARRDMVRAISRAGVQL